MVIEVEWKLKRFEELTTTELYEILRVRAEVFVVEQTCIYQDLDEKDKRAYHLYCEENGKVKAYLRILDKGVSYPEMSIGRVLTTENNRRKGLAREMMEKVIDFIKNDFDEIIERIDKVKRTVKSLCVKTYQELGEAITDEIDKSNQLTWGELLGIVESNLKKMK